MKDDREGFVEIGYIYVLVISALIFVSLTTMLSKTVEDEIERSVRVQLYEVGGKIEMNINNALIYANSHPDSQININIKIPTTVGGNRYAIFIDDDEMFLNSSATGTSIKFYLMHSHIEVITFNPRNGDIESILSSYGSINLKYSKGLNNNVIQLSENRN